MFILHYLIHCAPNSKGWEHLRDAVQSACEMQELNAAYPVRIMNEEKIVWQNPNDGGEDIMDFAKGPPLRDESGNPICTRTCGGLPEECGCPDCMNKKEKEFIGFPI